MKSYHFLKKIMFVAVLAFYCTSTIVYSVEVGPKRSRGDLANKGLAVSDNSSTKAYDPNLIAKSNGAPAIY
jgi:hypothetical protein